MTLYIVIALLVLFTMTTFTSLSELAISSVNPLRMKSLADSGNRAALAVLEIRRRPDLLFGALLVSNTVVNVIIPILILRLVIDLFTGMSQGMGDTVAVVGASFFITILEVFAKTLGTAQSEKMALLTGRPVLLLIRLLSLPVSMFNWISNSMCKVIGVTPGFGDETATLEDVRMAIRSAAEGGLVDSEEEQMMRRLSFLGELSVGDVMTPRTDITAFPRGLTAFEAARKVTSLPYSRYPIFGTGLDDIVGILHARDLIPCVELESLIILHDIVYPVFFVPESADLIEAMDSMRRVRTHMLIVVDEYGQTVGLLTMEDILEEIVGDINDEFDAEDQEIVKGEDGALIVKARVGLRTLASEHGVDIRSKARTVGGLVMHDLGALPFPGQSLNIQGYTIEVVSLHGRKIDRVVIRPATGESTEATAVLNSKGGLE